MQQFHKPFPGLLCRSGRTVNLAHDMRILIPAPILPIMANKSENSPTLLSPFGSEVQCAPNMSSLNSGIWRAIPVRWCFPIFVFLDSLFNVIIGPQDVRNALWASVRDDRHASRPFLIAFYVQSNEIGNRIVPLIRCLGMAPGNGR